MALTGAQIRQLRRLAHHLTPAVTIGKAGVGESTAAQAGEFLEAHELVKCAVLDASGLGARDAADELAEACGADVVQVIGHRFTLYRETSRDGVEKIKLV